MIQARQEVDVCLVIVELAPLNAPVGDLGRVVAAALGHLGRHIAPWSHEPVDVLGQGKILPAGQGIGAVCRENRFLHVDSG